MEKSKFLVIALIPLVLSIGMAPVLSYGNIFGTPKAQMDNDVATGDVLCRYGLDLMERPSGSVACIQPTSADKLNALGWETLVEGMPTLSELTIVEKTIEIDGLTVSYKEGGSPDSPTILLLHGFPTSSHMFRNLIPALENEFYLVAPDLIGYGKSSMPSTDEFEYTFDNQADIMNKFTEELGLTEYSMYVMDYGAPVGFRIFAEHPERVQAFIIQNGNAYEEGLETFWDDWKTWWNDKTPENEMKLHYLVSPDTTKWQYTFGMRDPNSVDQSTWITDVAGLQREGNVGVQLAMAYDYRTNLPLYPEWQEKFREHQPPALIVWGANDYIFPESGAHPYEQDLDDVEKHILDTGHFALENDLDFIAEKMSSFLNARLNEMPEQKEISAEFPFESKYVEVLGSQMHYIDEGEGDPVLFLHGNPTSSYLWRNVIPYVSDDTRVIAVDLIGMGKSDKPDIDYSFDDHARYLNAFIEDLELKDVTLVIHDWGSGLGFNYAANNEDNIKGIAFMEALLMPMPSYDAMPSPEMAEMFTNFRTPGIGEEMIMDQNIFVEQLLPSMIIRELSEEEFNYYSEPYPTPESRKPVWKWPNEIPIGGEPKNTHDIISSYNQWLQTTETPMLMIYATPGTLGNEMAVQWAEDNLMNLETVHIGPGLHFIQEDNPDAIGEAISDWYETIS